MDNPFIDLTPERLTRAKVVARALIFGPLVGGAPYNLFVLPIPFSYVIGSIPALFGGLLFAWWLDPVAKLAQPGAALGGLVGALCGAAGCWMTMALFALKWSPDLGLPELITAARTTVWQAWAWVLPAHGLFAGLVLGAWIGRADTVARSVSNLKVSPCAS
jgi:hypothetical protein